jgi:hypothetical protein
MNFREQSVISMGMDADFAAIAVESPPESS